MTKGRLNGAAAQITASEIIAARETGFPEDRILEARETVRGKARAHNRKVQYWAITDELEWTSTDVEDTHLRIFAATRLIYEYESKAGNHITDRKERIAVLKALVLRLAKNVRDRITPGLIEKMSDGEEQPAVH